MNMSNKSLFEKLFEEVMQDDAEALGLPSSEGGEGAGDMGGDMGSEEGGDEVTLTLDRATAQKLHDLLGGVLGGGEETEEGEGEMGEDEEGGYGSEDAEDSDESEDEDAEEESEKEEKEEDEDSEEMFEAPQSKYEKFETKAKAEQLQKQSNSRVQGAVANKTSAHGKAEKTAQTPGTAHYMPFNKKVDQAKPGGSIKVNNPKYNPSGQGDSIFG